MTRVKSKGFVLSALVLSLVLFAVPAYALDENQDGPEVIIKDGVNLDQDALDAVIESIIDENPHAGLITIYGGDNIVQEVPVITPYYAPSDFGYKNIKTTYSNKKSNQVLGDKFQFSVAKGESVTLTQDYEYTFSGSFTGSPFASASLGVGVSITGKYTKSTTYSGPSNSSPYNSREFRLKILGETGNWAQTADKWLMVNGKYTSFISSVSSNGTYKKPTSWLDYSVDSRQ